MYHITEQGPMPCKSTKGRCPYSKEENSHFENQADAYSAYETRLSNQYGTVSTSLTKKTASSRVSQKFPNSKTVSSSSNLYSSHANRLRIRESLSTPSTRSQFKSRLHSVTESASSSESARVDRMLKVKSMV